MTKRPPVNLRETFLLFNFFRPEAGLRPLLADIEFEGIDFADIVRVVHGRDLKEGELEKAVKPFSAANELLRALGSDEFRANLVPRFLQSFPEKKRILFIHIPRTAGSELSFRLVSRYPSLNSQLTNSAWRSTDRFFLAIKHLVLETQVTDSIFVHGHNTIDRYREWNAIRSEDRIFAVLRRPIEMMLSQLNYVLTRMFISEDRAGPDSRGWRKIFEVTDPTTQPTKSEVVELARRILRRQGVVPPNVICRFLGDGTASGAFERLATHNVEITDIKRYEKWFREQWNIARQTRGNASKPYIEKDDLSAADLEYIASVTSEDCKIFQKVENVLDRSERTSINGRALQELLT